MRKQQPEVNGWEDPRLASINDITLSEGLPLEPAVRSFFEKRFNRNFDSVRVHFDEHASRSTRLLNARAYTIGSHIVFAEGHYDPETRAGQWLLAHELTHVGTRRRPGGRHHRRRLLIAERLCFRIGTGRSRSVSHCAERSNWDPPPMPRSGHRIRCGPDTGGRTNH